MNWCPECLERSRRGVIQPASAGLTMPGREGARSMAADRHALDLLRAGFRPVQHSRGVVERFSVTHFTSLRADTTLPEPGEDDVGRWQTEAQLWVPRWVWVALSALDLPEGVRKRDAWLLELEDDPDLRDAVLSAHDLGGREAVRLLLLPASGPPARSKGGRWLRLLP